MSDDGFIREVDEELRSERMRQFWARYGNIIIGIAVAIVLVTAGYRFYDWYTRSQAQQAGDAFMSAVRLAETGKADEAIAALEKVEAEGTQTYKTLARMRLAAERAKAGDKPAAVETYRKVVDDSAADGEQRALARIRAGMLLVDTGTVSDVEQMVNPLAGPGGAYRHSAREALGLAQFKAGDLEAAFKTFKAISEDGEAPRGTQTRVNIMLNLIASRGGPKLEG